MAEPLSLADEAAAWAHYANCEALVVLENLAEVLGCREDQVEREVRRLVLGRWRRG